MTTIFHMNVEKTRKRKEPLSLEAQTLAALKARLPREAIALEMTQAPGIVICHRGRALGLHLMARGSRLSLAETNAVIALREAGMRVEIARGLEQALAQLREMGVALKEDETRALRDHFRQQTRKAR
jgi:hypothetical protein